MATGHCPKAEDGATIAGVRTACRVGLAVAAASVVGLTASASSGERVHATPDRATTRILHLGLGRAQGTAWLREPSGVVLLARISAPRGVRASVELTNADYAGPGVADITVASTPTRWSTSCRLHGGVNVCTEAVEWCPMIAATWRLHVTKQSGPAAPIRVDFVVGPKPRSRS
jgi:hypothetical protein